MAQIIDIQSYEGKRARRDDIRSGSAEILFFLGVRYERMPYVPPTSSGETPSRAPRRSRKKRA